MSAPELQTCAEGGSTPCGGSALDAQIRSLPIASLRRNYAQALTDWADTDTAVRLAARRVLTEFEVEGDSYGVPMIEDIVEALVARIEAQNGKVSDGSANHQ